MLSSKSKKRKNVKVKAQISKLKNPNQKPDHIKVLGIRTRAYNVENKSTLLVKNKEGLSLYLKGHIFWVGEHDESIRVNNQQMKQRLSDHRGFAYMEFLDDADEYQVIYCMITSISKTDILLYDLERPDAELVPCKIDKVQTLISNRMLIELVANREHKIRKIESADKS
jgi:hypothetical protein